MTSKTKSKNETQKTKYKNGINREHPGTTKSKVRFRQTLQEIPDIKCLFTSEMRAKRARQQFRK